MCVFPYPSTLVPIRVYPCTRRVPLNESWASSVDSRVRCPYSWRICWGSSRCLKSATCLPVRRSLTSASTSTSFEPCPQIPTKWMPSWRFSSKCRPVTALPPPPPPSSPSVSPLCWHLRHASPNGKYILCLFSFTRDISRVLPNSQTGINNIPDTFQRHTRSSNRQLDMTCFLLSHSPSALVINWLPFGAFIGTHCLVRAISQSVSFGG